MSRLEEIKKMLINTDKMERGGNRREIDFRYCAFESLKEAIEQKERVEELEEENEIYKMKYENTGAVFSRMNMTGRIEELENENERYKQALESIKGDIEMDYTEKEINNSPLLTVILEQIDQALKESEH